jgi:hypothetical protein
MEYRAHMIVYRDGEFFLDFAPVSLTAVLVLNSSASLIFGGKVGSKILGP